MEFYYGISNSSSLYHFGTKEHSGRYKWGSGDRPYQRLGGKERRQLKKSSRKLLVKDYAKAYDRNLTRGEERAVKNRSDRSLKGAKEMDRIDDFKTYVNTRSENKTDGKRNEKLMSDAIKKHEDIKYLNANYSGERAHAESLDASGDRYLYIKKHPYAFTIKEETQAAKEYRKVAAAAVVGMAAGGIGGSVASSVLGPFAIAGGATMGGAIGSTIAEASINKKRSRTYAQRGMLSYNEYANLYNNKYAKEISNGVMPKMEDIADKELGQALQSGTVMERDKLGRPTRYKLNV